METLKTFDELYNKFSDDRRNLCAMKRLIQNSKTGTNFNELEEAIEQKIAEVFNTFVIKTGHLAE